MMGHTAAPAEVTDLINDVMEQYHPELVEAGVTILTQFHYSAKGLKLHGYPCYAMVKITGEKDRAKPICMPDARIVIDGATWQGLAADTQRAIVDHELQHLSICRDKKNGKMLTDDNDRPKLKMRLHDLELGHFAVIAERHGAASVEARQAQTLVDSSGQLIWPWSGTSREEDADTADQEDVAGADADRPSRRRTRQPSDQSQGPVLQVAATG